MTEQMHFQAEVSRLLDIVANALYSNREIFLRELISNASDACDKLRYLKISNPALAEGSQAPFEIRVVMDAKARMITVSDNGIGMTKDELIKNLGTIAHSGTSEMLKNEADKKGTSLIGQFGVGFYSAFMVADKVEVRSRKAGEKTAYLWASDGKSGFVMDECLKDKSGTDITLYIKDDASEFLLEERLKQIIKTYSDHISFPIRMGEGEEAPIVNTASALWMRPKAEIREQDYLEFYHHVNGGMRFDKPWLTLHWRAEGAMEYHNLLFIPEMKPFDLYDPKRHHGVKLFVKRVFITDGLEGLIPPFLRFLKGVVDCEDLLLNISREMLQLNPMVSKMSSAITKKVLSELEKKATDEPEAFAQFWALFGSVVKEGLYDAHQHREQLLKVARFYSSARDGLISFEQYLEGMKEGQEYIYYLSGGDVDALKNSPQLEGFKAKGVEVLLMTDTIDEFWLPIQNDYKGKSFQSITRGDAKLSKIKSPENAPENEATDKGDYASLLTAIKTALGDQVKDVVISERLTDSPVCLVAAEGSADMHMERLLKKQQNYDAVSKRILEINPKHDLIKRMQAKAAVNDTDTLDFKDTAELLLDQARIIEGEALPDLSGFARRMAKIMAKAV
jgi:molecular chaperone HtpG